MKCKNYLSMRVFVNRLLNGFSSKLILLLAVALMTNTDTLKSQGWEKSFSLLGFEFAEEVVSTPDGGIVAIGVGEQYTQADFYVVRLDQDGDVLWEKAFERLDNNFGSSLTMLADGSFLLAGYGYEGDSLKNQVMIYRINADGEPMWPSPVMIGGTGDDNVQSIIPTSDGNFVLAGETTSSGTGAKDVLLIKMDANGATLWQQYIPDTLDNISNTVIQTMDGGFALAGTAQNPLNDSSKDLYILKTDPAGAPLWSKKFGGTKNEEGYDIVEMANGDLIAIGETTDPNNTVEAYAIRVNSAGDSLWSFTWNDGESARGRGIVSLGNGDVAVSGFIEVTNFNIDQFILRIAGDGSLVWAQTEGHPVQLELNHDIHRLADGSFILSGSLFPDFIDSDFYLVKLDSLGNPFSNYIKGSLFADEDADCEFDPGEPSFRDWIIKFSGLTNDNDYITDTDDNGNYQVFVDTGTYVINVITPNSLWEPCTPDTVVLNSFYDTTYVDLGLTPKTDCPILEVNVNTAYLRRCDTAFYDVSYCNQGSVTAQDAQLFVAFDEALIILEVINGPSVPTQIGDTLFFDLGDVIVGDCNTFQVKVLHDCSSNILFESHCVTARVLPDSFCLPPDPSWTGGRIAVDGKCNPGTVDFKITNSGSGDAPESLDFIVIEDNVIMFQGTLGDSTNNDPLAPGSDINLPPIPAIGKTYRLIVDQVPGHPGNSNPTVAVEGCVPDTNTNYSVGYVTQFPEDDGDPFISISCEENIAPNAFSLKRGYPKGYDSLHNYVDTPVTLEYTIVFQNVGTDTAFHVIIRDTLSEFLDPTTVQFLNSSHPVTSFSWTVSGVLKITFDSILLPPDNGNNDLYSTGHVTFRVSAQSGLDPGTMITNTAAIYFDFNLPNTTNMIFNTITDGITVAVDEIPENNDIGLISLKIYPNPTSEVATFELEWDRDYPKTVSHISQNLFTLTDVTGRLIRQEPFVGNTYTFHRMGLSPGLYFFNIQNDALGRRIGSGKIIIQ